MANITMNQKGGLLPLNTILQMLLNKLNQVDRKNYTREYQLEHELRMTLNILINFIVYNNDDPSAASDFTNS